MHGRSRAMTRLHAKVQSASRVGEVHGHGMQYLIQFGSWGISRARKRVHGHGCDRCMSRWGYAL